VLKALMHQKYNEATFNPVNPQSEIANLSLSGYRRLPRQAKSEIENPKSKIPYARLFNYSPGL